MNTLFWKDKTETSRRKLEDLAGEIADMDYTKFTEGEDYASLAKRYSSQGQKAMDDTVGKVAARTGGLASSYATAAGNQAYNEHMGKLEDAARGLYDSQRQEKIDNFNIRNSLYGQYYDAQRDSEANDQWKQQFDREGEQITYGRTQTLIEDEEEDLEDSFYYDPNAYPTYADYVAAFPGTLITEARFNHIRGIATGMYKEDNKPTDPVDPGSLSDTDKKIIEQYKWYVENNKDVPLEIQEQYNKIMGLPSIKVGEYTQKIADAKTYDEATTFFLELYKIDETAAYEALEAWEEQHPDLVPRDPNYYSGKASNAGYKYDVKQFS